MSDDRHNGLLTHRPPPVAPPGYTYTPTAGGYDIQQATPGMDQNIVNWAQDQPIDAAALASSALPVIGDIAGLANDIRHYWNEPEERTWRNFSMTGLGLFPFVPPAMPFTRAVGALANGKQNLDHIRDGATYDESSSERDMLAQLLRGNS
jgi:hypothetical protein